MKVILLHSAEHPYLIEQIGSVDTAAEGFAGVNAKDFLEVLAHTICSCGREGNDWDIRKLLLQHAQLAIVWPDQ